MKRILLVHAGNAAIMELRKQLEDQCLQVVESAYGDIIILVSQVRPDLVVINPSPETSYAMEACARLRGHFEFGYIPLVLIGEGRSETERILALELGANDYIVEPFSAREAVARIRVHLRSLRDPRCVLRSGKLELDRYRREARLNGRGIPLTPNEFRILEVLMSHAGVVLTARELLEQGWGKDTEVNEGAVKVYIVRLRRKLRDSALQQRIIRSVRGFGYCLEPGTARLRERKRVPARPHRSESGQVPQVRTN